MKAVYRGCAIDSHREKSLGGWSEVYWSAFSADGYEINSGFGGGNVREMFSAMKSAVNEFLDEFGGDWKRHSDETRRLTPPETKHEGGRNL